MMSVLVPGGLEFSARVVGRPHASVRIGGVIKDRGDSSGLRIGFEQAIGLMSPFRKRRVILRRTDTAS